MPFDGRLEPEPINESCVLNALLPIIPGVESPVSLLTFFAEPDELYARRLLRAGL